MTEARRRKYLENRGHNCLHCGSTLVRRLVDSVQMILYSTSQPEVIVGCSCAKCGHDWSERYRLESVIPGETS